MATVHPEQGQVENTGHSKKKALPVADTERVWGCGLSSWAREAGGAGPQSWWGPPLTGPCEVTAIVHTRPALSCHHARPEHGGAGRWSRPRSLHRPFLRTLAARAGGTSWLPPISRCGCGC